MFKNKKRILIKYNKSRDREAKLLILQIIKSVGATQMYTTVLEPSHKVSDMKYSGRVTEKSVTISDGKSLYKLF